MHVAYFNVHHQFEERWKASEIDYSIIKPPAVFSGFLDMMDMAKRGQLFTIGKGDKRTNPVYEVDLANECINSIKERNATMEIGGKTIYTRRQLNGIIQSEVCPAKKTRNVPLWLFTSFLPILKVFRRNMYDKFAFFLAVLQEDTIAPQIGEMKFEDYIRLKNRG